MRARRPHDETPHAAVLADDQPREALADDLAALRPELPILLVTGYASETTPLDDMPGDIPTLRKPFDQQALAAVLSALLSPNPATEAESQCP